eukprot:CAMPEP_0178999286 /NCGR_PEP_ID=MMETSP0795-20121207/9966_1 /TAXON_ID=88552 /ORGANISM="Amoebophrya sp., Strain Ameob2" /LENGTH=72 /DNA_ID=CAMNT_0020692023 /DNA_START=281 /DNA_END=499 /DNA_ORIENTATION=+
MTADYSWGGFGAAADSKLQLGRLGTATAAAAEAARDGRTDGAGGSGTRRPTAPSVSRSGPCELQTLAVLQCV